MASASDLKLISDRLKQLKGNQSLPFGGIDIIFTGDFAQLPSISYPLFKDYREIKTSHIFPSNVTDGASIWFDWLNSALELKFNFRSTPSYAKLLKRFRFNKPTQKDLLMLNSRMVSVTNVPPGKTSIVVPTNAEPID